MAMLEVKNLEVYYGEGFDRFKVGKKIGLPKKK